MNHNFTHIRWKSCVDIPFSPTSRPFAHGVHRHNFGGGYTMLHPNSQTRGCDMYLIYYIYGVFGIHDLYDIYIYVCMINPGLTLSIIQELIQNFPNLLVAKKTC